jgi:hypothetical protein
MKSAQFFTVLGVLVTAAIGGLIGKAINDWVDWAGWLWPTACAVLLTAVWLVPLYFVKRRGTMGKARRNRSLRRAAEAPEEGAVPEHQSNSMVTLTDIQASGNGGDGIRVRRGVSVAIHRADTHDNGGDGIRVE